MRFKSVEVLIGGLCAVAVLGLMLLLAMLGPRPSGPSVLVPGAVAVHHPVWVSYSDPYGSTAPGGAPAPDGSLSGVAGQAVGSAVDGLSQVPFALLGGVVGVLVLWWGQVVPE